MDTSISKPEEQSKEPEMLNSKFFIVAAITASLDRKTVEEGVGFKITVGDAWNLNNTASIDFVEKVEKKFRKKNKFHSYFSGLPSNRTPANLNKYIDNSIDFKELARLEMTLLQACANEQDGSSLVGGKIVFMHYKNIGDDSDDGRLLIVMVDNKGAFEFEKVTLEPKKLQPIDTDALRQAAMFDLTLFSEIYPKQEGAAYLQFIEGRSRAEFFKSALGCDSDVSNKESVTNIFEAIKKFSALHALKAKEQEKITSAVYDHIENNLGKQIELKVIQKVIDKSLPYNHQAHGKFSRFANENDYKVNAIFEATKYSLNQSVSFKITDSKSNYTLNIKAASIGYSGKPVIVDKDLKYMKIPLSPHDRDAIREVIGDK